MMIRTGGRRPRSSVARTADADLLSESVWQVEAIGLVRRDRVRCGRDVPDEPVKNVIESVSRAGVQIVKDQYETLRCFRRAAPLNIRRFFGAGLSVNGRNLPAVRPGG